MPRNARLYVALVAITAVVVAAFVLPRTRWDQIDPFVFCVLAALQALIVLSSRFPALAESPAVPASVAVQLAAVVLLMPGAAAASIALGGLCLALRPGPPADRAIFVLSGIFLTPIVGDAVYTALHGSRTLMRPEMPSALMPIVIAALALSAVPAFLIGTMTVIAGQARVKAATREALRHAIPRNVAYSFAGLLAATLWRHHAQFLATVVMIGPLLVTRWAYTQYHQQRAAHDATVRALVQAVEIKDLYTRGHSERVARGSEMIARRLGMEEANISILRYAAILHDVGKLGVPTRLLQKDGKFDESELETIRVHPVRGVDVVRDIAFLKEAYTAILHHHERMDGRGYPTGLAGERIPRFARIIAVADAFDSMTSTRSYRPARSMADALAELRACSGSQFDPVMVDAMHEALAEAEREGRRWFSDSTVRAFARDGSPLQPLAADAGALKAGASAGLGADVLVNIVSGNANAVAHPAAPYADLAVPLLNGEDAGATGFDHDDPAFVVPSPLSERSQPERAQPERSQPERAQPERSQSERGQPERERSEPPWA